jgi:hypothetical protein
VEAIKRDLSQFSVAVSTAYDLANTRIGRLAETGDMFCSAQRLLENDSDENQ